jgi:lysophospholipase L1-like esterase
VARVDLKAAVRKLLFVAAPATLLAAVVAAIAIESWVRLSWDDRRGRPGFYVSDAELGQRLSPNYDGWFAGVPVKINALGFRDDRDYALDKREGTFRILVVGDSVTFGHGTRSDTTYPYLLEQRLREWKPEIEWQVWNLGVPGYATSQELAYLERVGARYDPDLVIVGFYENDLTGNEPARSPSMMRRLASATQGWMQRYLYSYEFYKRGILTLRWRLLTDEPTRQRLEHLITQEIPLMRQDYSAGDEEQELTPVDRFDAADIQRFRCDQQPVPDRRRASDLRARLERRDAEIAAWLDAVHGFERLAEAGAYRIVFFINMAPEVCEASDRFYDGGSLEVDEVLRGVLGRGIPVVSTVRDFLQFRPSQMPGAAAHSVGNANRVKADALFQFLRNQVLTGILQRPIGLR